MNLKGMLRLGATSGLLLAVMTTYSMVAMAVERTAVGDIAIAGKSVDRPILVNGNPAVAGETIFNGATIVTPAEATATLNLGNAGRIAVEPNSSFTVVVERGTISGSLSTGSLTVLSSAQPAVIHTLNGDVKLSAGESANANSTRAARDHRDANGNCIDDDKDGDLECRDRVPGWVWFAIAGGVAAAVIIGVTAGSDDNNVVVSPLS